MPLDPFISEADVVDKIGRGETADPGMTIAVDTACEMVRTLAEQSFNRGTTTVTMDGTGTDALLLPEHPVNSVGTVTIGTAVLSSDTYAVRDDGVLVLLSGTAWATQPIFSDEIPYYEAAWPKGRQNIEVTYDHGYTEVPADVRGVALEAASRQVIQGPVMFETLGPASARYSVAATDFTEGERAILRKYRRSR
jgi:hypothetical protein